MTGIVQGVGFRPFVFRIAFERGLAGWVLNAGDGVHIHAEGTLDALDGLAQDLVECAPPRSEVESVVCEQANVEGFSEFSIRLSNLAKDAHTFVSPDIATCPECLAELFDPDNRRYHYPFINCTQCGPRFTIIKALPYDRISTSMAPFKMCPACDTEYHDPVDRRFHAQPDACFECGPELIWAQGDGIPVRASGRDESDALIERASALLQTGGILAIKGLGGYHLACDADCEEAVSELRRRKHRPRKPFAIMAPSLDALRAVAEVSEAERELLEGSVRPIVLLRRKQDSDMLAEGVCCGLGEVGAMLPYTPVQHLLLHAFGRPLVMTSGNISEEPIIADDGQAQELLAGVADAFLSNDRGIVARYDDSVVRVMDGTVLPVRRARGYAPHPLALPNQLHGLEPVLACGPEQKATFCFTRDSDAFISQHLGDLGDASSFAAWTESMWLYRKLFDLTATAFVTDMHPGYLSTQWAVEHGEGYGIAIERVQHHHAHIAAVTGEHEFSGKVIGVALDGTGFGGCDSGYAAEDAPASTRAAADGDGTVWGGEVLICDWLGYERYAHLAYLPLPGGESAITHPGRLAWAWLLQHGLEGCKGAHGLRSSLSEEERVLVAQMVEKGINCPLTSSAGRLLDAMAAITGACREATYDGEPAIDFEACMGPLEEVRDDGLDDEAQERYRFALVDPGQGGAHAAAGSRASLVIDPAPAISAALQDIAAACSQDIVSRRFHDSLASAIVAACARAHADTGIDTVALGGGVFMNRRLLERIRSGLEGMGLHVLIGKQLPANDGCISYGQAIVALARQKLRKEQQCASPSPHRS